MLIAQSFGEYGAASALVAAVQSALNQAENFIRGMGMKDYFILGVAGLVLFMLLGRRG
jgi:hypothetical protein